MSDRTRNGKSFAQDALGFLFILVGGFFAVSIVLFLRGQEPKAGVVGGITWPVVELVTLLGSLAALLLSSGLAVLGTLLFLRPASLAALRPLTALLSWSLGTALIVGVFGGGGELGAWLPALVVGFAGRALAVVLGLALAWLGWTVLSAPRRQATTSAEAVQRIGLAARHDAAAGVSSAEAALLVSEPRPGGVRSMPRREEPAPVRDETIRPHTPSREAPSSEPRARRAEAFPVFPRTSVEPFPIPPAVTRSSGVNEPPASVVASPTPSWESTPEGEAAEGAEEEQTAAASTPELEEREEQPFEPLSGSLPGKLMSEFDTEEVTSGIDAELGDAGPAPPPGASWEQIELFDDDFDEEVEELGDEAPPARSGKVELTPSFDFESGEARKPAHEPEPSEADPFAAAPARVEPAGLLENEPENENEDFVEHPAASSRAPASTPDFLLKPVPKADPVVTRDVQKEYLESEPLENERPESERWSQLVFEAGCAILEQKRVAVSMLERRFGIDFDQACRVLDELQQAGLIGPYMGGRTRDILLSREEWLPHAPHAP